MFDAKQLLDQIIGGGAQRHAGQSAGGQAGGLGGLGDLLGQLAGGSQSGGQSGSQSGGQSGGMGGLGDLLGQITGGAQGGGQSGGSGGAGGMGDLGDLLRQFTGDKAGPGTSSQGAGNQASGQGGQSGGDGGFGGLGDLLGNLQERAGKSSGGSGAGNDAGGGGIMDILGQVLGQATNGVKEGAGKISDATGAGQALENMTGGKSADDLMAQLKDLIANNKLGAGAAAGGLGALVLGTQTGRGLAVDAAKLGGLVLIGGLAYKAYQNYQNGKPLINTAETDTDAAPQGSGFEADAVSNDSALLYIRSMIAAAAADGRIDEEEQKKIFGSVDQAGFGDEAHAFLQNEFNNPATPQALASAASTPEEGVQVFTAARMAIDFDNVEEQQFLMTLASELDLAPDLIQHIDAAARGTATA